MVLRDIRRLTFDQLYWPTFVLLLAGSAALSLAYRYLPLADWPEHLAQDAIVSHLHDRPFAFDHYYRTTGWFLPYQGFRWLHIALATVFGGALGGRIALLSYLVGTPLAASLIVNRLGRDRWISLATFCMLVDSNFLWGFAPHVFGTTLLLVGIVSVLDYLRSGRTVHAIFTAILGVALFFTHAQQTALWLASSAAIIVVAKLQNRVSWTRTSVILAALVPAVWLLLLFLMGAGWINGTAVHDEFAIIGRTTWASPSSRYWSFPISTGLALTGWPPFWLLASALMAASVGALIVRFNYLKTDNLSRRSDYSFVATVLFLLWSALVWGLPIEFRGQTIAPRIASLSVLALIWLIPWRAVAKNQSQIWLNLPRIGIVLAAAASLGWTHHRFYEFNQTMEPLERAVATVPLGSRIASMMYGVRPTGFRVPSYLHLGGYFVSERGGMASVGFTRTGVTYRDEIPRYALMVNQLWSPSVTGWKLSLRRFGPFYDYVVVTVGKRYHGSPFTDDMPSDFHTERVFHEGNIELWRITQAESPAAINALHAEVR